MNKFVNILITSPKQHKWLNKYTKITYKLTYKSTYQPMVPDYKQKYEKLLIENHNKDKQYNKLKKSKFLYNIVFFVTGYILGNI